jgi:hypothetical protein
MTGGELILDWYKPENCATKVVALAKEIGGVAFAAVQMETQPMSLKRLMLSLSLGLAGGGFAYLLAWGLFTTHPELGMEPSQGRVIAMWVSPIAFLASLIYLQARGRRG